MTIPLVALVLAAPLLLLAAAVVGLVAHGPLGWLAALVLVAGTGLATRWSCRRCWAWWASTKAPVRPLRTGSRTGSRTDSRTVSRTVSGGTGPAAAGRPAPPGGTSRG